MKTFLRITAGLLAFFLTAFVAVLFVWPRPPDTTDPRIFEGDAGEVDHCDLPILDGNGLRADDIPKAFTPGCGYERFPLPVLADCREPLAPGVVDLRGLWHAEAGPLPGHVERIEQCGDRLIVTAGGVIHDFRTDGSVARGSRDIEPPLCVNTWVSIEWVDEVLSFHPFGLPYTIVTRRSDGDEVVFTYPRFEGEIRMKRICRVPERLL
jgi:hypothetical protein